MKSSLIILTFNEIEGAKVIFDKIPLEKFDECFVIDNNSTDGTVEFLKEKGIKIIFQDKPGRGEAFRIAVKTATGDILIFFSIDGNEDPADTIKLMEAIKEGYDLAIASRFMPQSRNDESYKLLPWRAWANQIFTFLANVFFGGNLSDAINGFRAVKKGLFEELKLDGEGFTIEYQMSIRATKLKKKIKEITTIENVKIGKSASFLTGLRVTFFPILKTLFREICIGKSFLKK